jgi:hypothetical protein
MQLAPAPGLSPETAKIRTQLNDIPIGGKLTVPGSVERNTTATCRPWTRTGFLREVDLKQIVSIKL